MSILAGVPNVLLLGEANFAFAAALATFLSVLRDGDGLQSASDASAADAYLRLGLADCRSVHLVVSGIEAREEVLQKYPEATGIFNRLQALPRSLVEVRHGVNAMDLSASFGEGEFWTGIAWNHPHLGAEDLRLHSALLAHFFSAAVASLREGGRIVLSLLEGQETRWGLQAQAARHSLIIVGVSPFEASRFPGYECKRNHTGKSFKSLSAQRQQSGVMRSWTYHLRRKSENPEVEPMPLDSPLAAGGNGQRGRVGDADPNSSRPAVAGLACDVCGRTFSSAQGLRTHVRQVHELKKYGEEKVSAKQLTERGRSSGSKEASQQHVAATHRAGSDRSVDGKSAEEVLECPKVNDTQSEMETVECSICGMRMPKGTDERTHLLALMPITEKVLKCPCGRSFANQRALDQHSRSCAEARAAQSTLVDVVSSSEPGPGCERKFACGDVSCWRGLTTCLTGCCGSSGGAK